MPENPHAIRVTIERGWLRAEFTCTADEGAVCRMHCPKGCEEWDWDHAGTTGHLLVDYGRCVKTEWMENGDWQDDYEGDRAPLVCAPIEFTWHGDHYTWSYAPVEATVT